MSKSLLYIHGFNSSPQSHKAVTFQRMLHGSSVECCIPALAGEPDLALAELTSLVESQNFDGIVGSSMGGFFATWLSEQYKIPAVLINPAVRPHVRLAELMGMQQNFHTDNQWEFTQAHVDFLEAHEVSPSEAQRFLVLLQSDDETLDYRQAQQKYADCSLFVSLGGDHSYQYFADMVPAILRFFGISFSTQVEVEA